MRRGAAPLLGAARAITCSKWLHLTPQASSLSARTPEAFNVVRTLSTQHSFDAHGKGSFSQLLAAGALAGGALATSLYWAQSASAREQPAQPAAVLKSQASATSSSAPAPSDKDLPQYTKEEVAKHKTKESGIWVTFKDGVYDITEFVELHPGGKHKIMLAAGGSVEPFWAMYQQHTKQEVRDILAEYHIGTLKGYSEPSKDSKDSKDPYANDPERHPALVYRSEKPCNAETPGHILAASLLTPNDVFYVRNHLPVPQVDPATYTLRIEGEGVRSIELNLDQLKSNFKKHTLAATVQCAGNRRNEMKAIKPVKGLDWDTGALGTAEWSGVRLADVLAYAGLNPEDPTVQHVHFIGLDADPTTGDVYGASIPVENATSPAKDVLLAFEMNGQDIPRDHGYPVRVIVPGVVGARNVKWLSKIVTSSQESSSHWQQKDYKSFCPSVDWDTVDWESAPAIQELPVTSAITEPVPGTQINKSDKDVTVRGYALSGGGRDVVRVDVSADGGKTWQAAKLQKVEGQKQGHAWAWTLWETTVPLPQDGSPVELVAKATDAAYNSQPDSVGAIWNLRGVVNNAWHRVKLEVV